MPEHQRAVPKKRARAHHHGEQDMGEARHRWQEIVLCHATSPPFPLAKSIVTVRMEPPTPSSPEGRHGLASLHNHRRGRSIVDGVSRKKTTYTETRSLALSLDFKPNLGRVEQQHYPPYIGIHGGALQFPVLATYIQQVSHYVNLQEGQYIDISEVQWKPLNTPTQPRKKSHVGNTPVTRRRLKSHSDLHLLMLYVVNRPLPPLTPRSTFPD